MIVVISHPNDLHAQRVLEQLARWQRDAFLFDIGDLPSAATLTIDYAEPIRPAIRLAHERAGRFELGAATAVWWRRPQLVRLDTITDADARGFTFGEWHEALHGMYHLVDCPWMNPPQNDEAASRKALQLRVASSLGLRIPDTLMTSDAEEARRFIDKHGISRTVYKIFSATERVWRETRLLNISDLALLDQLKLAPVIFQEYIPARADIRVTIVGDAMFAMAIESRGRGSEVDFRVNLSDAGMTACDLPDREAAALRALMKHFGIVYGAVDLRLTPDEEYVFLEVNPAGEFLFAEHGSGYPITAAVAGWLASPAF